MRSKAKRVKYDGRRPHIAEIAINGYDKIYQFLGRVGVKNPIAPKVEESELEQES